MKKKVLGIAALVCALSVSCLLGASACNGGDNADTDAEKVKAAPSIEVTKEQWDEAFEKTLEATNLTVRTTGAHTDGSELTSYSYAFDNQAYENTVMKKVVNKEVVAGYDAIFYYTIEGTTKYCANRIEKDWEVYAEEYGKLTSSLQYYYSTAQAYLETLDYDNYTFADGKYSFKPVNGSNTITATVKIGENGCLSFFEYQNIYATYSMIFYNYGSTSYKVPSEVKKVIDDYKANN
ncbi:MAG: hypothetical protein K2H78_02445 [Clostridia bacterium]|nr:hypothetical protein [Clostridia bacterium]